ncbi:hypothetical protein C8Q79DRAFT_570026 [Trametes meyenii]|nr:hypothetical protein C8Q79DRAFT_570026 [Trametes meyenii]
MKREALERARASTPLSVLRCAGRPGLLQRRTCFDGRLQASGGGVDTLIYPKAATKSATLLRHLSGRMQHQTRLCSGTSGKADGRVARRPVKLLPHSNMLAHIPIPGINHTLTNVESSGVAAPWDAYARGADLAQRPATSPTSLEPKRTPTFSHPRLRRDLASDLWRRLQGPASRDALGQGRSLPSRPRSLCFNSSALTPSLQARPRRGAHSSCTSPGLPTRDECPEHSRSFLPLGPPAPCAVRPHPRRRGRALRGPRGNAMRGCAVPARVRPHCGIVAGPRRQCPRWGLALTALGGRSHPERAEALPYRAGMTTVPAREGPGGAG